MNPYFQLALCSLKRNPYNQMNIYSNRSFELTFPSYLVIFELVTLFAIFAMV